MGSFSIKFFADFIGEDPLGNLYYQSQESNYLGQKVRRVLYKSGNSISSVSPCYHAWLHYMTDQFPTDKDNNHAWQKEYKPEQYDFVNTYAPVVIEKRKIFDERHSSWCPSSIK